ncbi:hypothetical protein BDZ45DRAFT_682441 [Acephala macrosclerotiorum]|nr:hypothetical protein BDZ45DRAFT_682441 [Acephala macrosclerotiorum]
MASLDSLETPLSLKLLRLAPLVISSAYFMCGIDQATAINPFSKPDLAVLGGPVLPNWFPKFFDRTILVVGLGYPLAFATALTNTLEIGGGAQLSQTSRYLYYAGMAFSAGHFLYGPYAMSIIARINEKANPGKKNSEATKDWLRMNAIRLATVDGPGWAMYFAAVLSAVKF